jgi:hypothetical protein
LNDVETSGLRKKWLWNWYFVVILGSSSDSYKKGKTSWKDKFTDGRIILEKIDDAKYNFYEYLTVLKRMPIMKNLTSYVLLLIQLKRNIIIGLVMTKVIMEVKSPKEKNYLLEKRP